MASLARTSGRVALVATVVVWTAVTAVASSVPPTLDDDGRLSDTFIAEVRRQDEAQWLQQYTVHYTGHVLDYGFEWERVEGGLRVVEFEGFVQANVVTGAHSVSQNLTRAFPEPPHGVGSHISSGDGYYNPYRRDPFWWAYRILSWGGRKNRRTKSLADMLDGVRVTSCTEEGAADGVLVRIVTDRRDSDGRVATPAFRREIVLNLSRGYRPQRIVEHDERAGTRTETDIELSQHPEAGIWTASRVHQRVYDLRGDEDLRQERIYEFNELTPRTHLRIRP